MLPKELHQAGMEYPTVKGWEWRLHISSIWTRKLLNFILLFIIVRQGARTYKTWQWTARNYKTKISVQRKSFVFGFGVTTFGFF